MLECGLVWSYPGQCGADLALVIPAGNAEITIAPATLLWYNLTRLCSSAGVGGTRQGRESLLQPGSGIRMLAQSSTVFLLRGVCFRNLPRFTGELFRNDNTPLQLVPPQLKVACSSWCKKPASQMHTPNQEERLGRFLKKSVVILLVSRISPSQIPRRTCWKLETRVSASATSSSACMRERIRNSRVADSVMAPT